MTESAPRRLWLPYLIVGVGLFFSLILSYLLWLDNLADNVVMNQLEHHLHWLAFLSGLGITLLLAGLTRMAQVASQNAIILDRMNENLKKEIAERLQMEESKQKLELALHQGQKLQAMGTLAGGIAHDFNNLLYAIIGYVEMAREDVEKDSLLHQNLGKVLEASHRGQELVARILAFSRRQHHNVEIIRLQSVIEAALGLLRPTIPASVAIHFETSSECAVLANQTQIHQVLVNMINNAVDAMDGEGLITIRLTHAGANDPLLMQFPEIEDKHKPYCKIEITDTGHGMDQPTLARIFEPFYTTKEVGKGTGLGLSIVHAIIKEHHGVITVQSKLGHGTTFVILLPEQPTEQGENHGNNLAS